MDFRVLAFPILTAIMIWHGQLFIFNMTAYKLGEWLRSQSFCMQVCPTPYLKRRAYIILDRSKRL